MQSDPIGLRGGVNTYSYVFNNAINGKGPFGLSMEGALSQLGDLLDWVTGTLNSPSYGPNDAVTQDLCETPGWADIWSQYDQAGCKDGTYCSNFQYEALVSTDNVVGQTVGSFCATLSSQGSTVQVDAWNTWGLESATRFPEFPGMGSNRSNASIEEMITQGASPFQWPKSILENTGSGWFTTTKTTYHWTETNPCPGC